MTTSSTSSLRGLSRTACSPSTSSPGPPLKRLQNHANVLHIDEGSGMMAALMGSGQVIGGWQEVVQTRIRAAPSWKNETIGRGGVDALNPRLCHLLRSGLHAAHGRDLTKTPSDCLKRARPYLSFFFSFAAFCSASAFMASSTAARSSLCCSCS